MINIIDKLKSDARILHKQAKIGQAEALQRITASHDFDDLPANQISAELKRRHCLNTLGREYGFKSWTHLKQIIEGQSNQDFGCLLYSDRCAIYTNIWFAQYPEAKAAHQDCGGYLLAYKTQCLIVQRDFIETLGLDPDDPDWSKIAYDWIEPNNLEARARLYGRIITARNQR